MADKPVNAPLLQPTGYSGNLFVYLLELKVFVCYVLVLLRLETFYFLQMGTIFDKFWSSH